MTSLLNNCQLIDLPGFYDMRGSLNFVEGTQHIPFTIARVFYLYNSPVGGLRGQHAHKILEQFIICISGMVNIILDNGKQETQNIILNKPTQGLYIPAMTWVELELAEPQTICLVFASYRYDESDYYRNYDEFIKAAHEE